jgi:hypothetical protein
MRTRSIAALAGIAALAVFLVGCGGGGGDDTTASLTKAAMIKQGDAICIKTSSDLSQRYAAFAKEKSSGAAGLSQEASLELGTEVFLPAVQAEIDRLRELSPPSDGADEVEAFLDAAEEGVEEGEAEPKALLGDGDQYPFTKADELAQAYGFKACGNR